MDKRKLLISSIIGLACLFVIGIVFAAIDPATGIIASKNYAIDVINKGEEPIISDDNVEVSTKVIEEGDTEITLETSVKNTHESKVKQVCFVLDTSYSMDINAEGLNVKTAAINLATSIFNNVANVRMSVVDSSGTARTTNQTALNNVTSAINASSGGYDISEGLAKAKEILTPSETIESYLIVLTDATDNVDLSIFSTSEMNENQKIKVYSLLTGITSTAFGSPESPMPSDGTVYMIDDFINNNRTEEVINNLNKAVKNINAKIEFEQEILRSASRGNFSVELLTSESNGDIIQNSDGSLNWNVEDPLKVGQTTKVRYKLKLNTSATIGTASLYNDIKVVKNVELKYTYINNTTEETINTTETGIVVQICDAYDLIIHAVAGETTSTVEGVKFNVVGTDSDGKIIINETGLVTDKNGNVRIKRIKQLGVLNFDIIPDVTDLKGYIETDPVVLSVNNQYDDTYGGNLSFAYDKQIEQPNDDNGKRSITVPVSINMQTFGFSLNAYDLSDPDIKIPNIEFRLIQPKLNNKYEMDALYGTTDRNGNIMFNATVMSQAGTYDYIISQMSDKDGYESVGNATVRVTFDDEGNVVLNGVDTLFNTNIEAVRESNSLVSINVREKCNSSNTFNMQINLKDDKTNEPINATIYEILVTKISGDRNDEMTYTKVTDENGNINLKAIASESGYTKIKIHQLTADNAYIKDTNDKEIIIDRQNGIIYDIKTGGDFAKKDPDNRNGIIVSLTNHQKSEKNLVRMHLTQKDDTVLNLINIPMRLTDITPNGSGITYDAVTNGDGYADFALQSPSEITDGTYYFQVTADYYPAGYIEPDVVGTIKLSIIDGKIAEIIDVSEIGSYAPIKNIEVTSETTDSLISYIAYSDYVLTADSYNSSYVQIQLLDNDNGTPIKNGKYEIRMERDGAQIANAGSTGKYTGEDGYTTKMSIPGLDSEPVNIIISQVYDETRQTGYKVDTNIYSIVVHKDSSGILILDSASLEDGTDLPTNIPMPTFLDLNRDGKNDTIVFTDKNTIINPGDVLLDFTVVKFDYATGFPAQNKQLCVWSDDFLIYDEEKNSYETFSLQSPYNPFSTGVNNQYISKGQIEVRLKPINLPKVEDVNRDGYPIAGAVIYIGEYNQTTGSVIDETKYNCQVNFTYSRSTGTYKYSGYSNLSNWALLKDFHHSTSMNSGEGYVESATLELWTNYGETSNFALDMSKYNFLGQELPGAKYTVKVTSPTGEFLAVTQDVLNGNNTIELPELYVQKGSIISIKEDTAPIGYEVDSQEANFIVDSIDTSVKLVNIKPYGTTSDRITLNGSYWETSQATGENKFVQKIKLVDIEKNNVRLGITTQDYDDGNVKTEGNSYSIVTRTGASATTPDTNVSGMTETLIGGKQRPGFMYYTISQEIGNTNVAKFYKRLAYPINITIYFDENGNIESDPASPYNYNTLNSQNDPTGYGVVWSIKETSANGFNIVIYQHREDPLNVNFKTVDAFTNATLTGATLVNTVEYCISPSEGETGKGYNSAKVGFVYPSHTVSYELTATMNTDKYAGIPVQQFIVNYDVNGNVNTVTVPPSSQKYITATKNSSNSKTIDITINLEPTVPFVIKNVDINYNEAADDLNLRGGKFTITKENEFDNITTTEDVATDGRAVLQGGKFGQGNADGNEIFIYKVHQNEAGELANSANKYGTIDDFKIQVEYDSNRNIVGASVYENTLSTDRYVKVSFKRPSESSDAGYNGNNKGIVNIQVKNDLAFHVDFTNEDRLDGKKLSGSKYLVESSIPTTGTSTSTDLSGNAIAYVDRTQISKTVTYTITEINRPANYQTLPVKIKIEVDFDSNGYVDGSNIYAARIIEGNDYATASIITPVNNRSDNFGIKVTIKSLPQFRINIDNISRKDYNLGATTNLAGAQYSITSDYNTNANVTKSTVHSVTAMLGNTPLNNYVTYTIHEEQPATDYQTILKDIKVKVHFDINGCVDDVALIDSETTKYTTAEKATNIVNTEDNLTVNLSIRNNPIIFMKLKKTDADASAEAIQNGQNIVNNVKFSIVGKIKGTEDVVYSSEGTTVNGMLTYRIDRGLDNKTIVYTIKEEKNAPGYEYVQEDLNLEISYDNEGKIALDNEGNRRAILTPQVEWASTSNIEDYQLNLNVSNSQIKEIGINLSVTDKYDSSKKVQGAKIKAYLAQATSSMEEDTDHTTTLVSGSKDYGIAYETIGKVTGKTEATLVLKEIETPKQYYSEAEKKLYDNIYMSWLYFAISSGRIDMTFTDEGKISGAWVVPNTIAVGPLGKCLDGQYLTVNVDPNKPYILNINLYYYPMLEMSINAVSDDSYSRAADSRDNDLIGTYTVKTQHFNDYISIWNSETENLRQGLVKAGYMGNSIYGGIVPDPITQTSKVFNNTTQEYELNNFPLWVGEQFEVNNSADVATNGRIRYVYIYEPRGSNSEPSGYINNQLQYQQHGQQDNSPNSTAYNNALIGAIQVTYNEKGEIVEAKILEDRGAFSRNRTESGDTTKYITTEISDNKHGLNVKIQYKRTTSMEVKVVDRITDTEISDVTLYPCKNNTVNTNRFYQWTSSVKERNLARGEKEWTYWGGNDANGSRTYIIGSKFNNPGNYNGYEDIGDIVLEVHYDEFGYVDTENSRVVSTNSNGELNAQIVADKDKIYLKIIATRKFDIRINKKDGYDESKRLNDARFNITSSKSDIRDANGNLVNTKSNIVPETRTQVGLMHASTTVKYTITETYTPEGYIPMTDTVISVVFDEAGVISKVLLEDDTVLYDMYTTVQNNNGYISVTEVAEIQRGLKPRDINDLTIEIKNYPKFVTNVNLKDEFYSNEGIPEIKYTIKDVTHSISANGDTTTNERGVIATYTGTVYPSATVRYTFKQNNTPNGYYASRGDDIVDVTFDDNGYIDNFTHVSGYSNIVADRGTRTLTVNATNKPKDFKIGIEKGLEGVEFRIKREDAITSGSAKQYDVTTRDDGTVIQTADTFTVTENAKEYIYTISETKQLDGYRKIEDIVIKVRYLPDGRIDYIDTISNESGATINPAISGSLERLSSGEKVNLKLNIVNDNKYNLVVINEDSEISNSRIAGTVYNVNINGTDLSASNPEFRTTNSNGTVKFANRTEMGELKLKVSEVSIGNGYRGNLSNNIEFIVDKGIETYSLELNQSNFDAKGYTLLSGPDTVFDNTYGNGSTYTIKLNDTDETEAIIGIFEGTGNITVMFKNESKSKLTVTKIDVGDAAKRLPGAEFKIVAQEIDEFGNLLGEENVISESSTTDIDGKIEIDLGKRPVNKIIRYTFKELAAPVGYEPIQDVSIVYTYGADGKITSRTSEYSRRLLGDESWYDVNVVIRNGDLAEEYQKYTVKIISIDSKYGSTAVGASNNRINGSTFDITIKDSEGRILSEKLNEKTAREFDNFGYPEDGIITLKGLKATGKISVDINQTGVAEGYYKEDNNTTGTVTFENTNESNSQSGYIEASLSNLEYGGFINSYIDQNENEVIIKVYNDPQVKLKIHKINKETKEKLKDAKFTITSQIDGRNHTNTIQTSLNVQTLGTDEFGNESIIIGAPEYGKTVVYTIKEEKLANYDKLEDIKLKIIYDTQGKINDWEVLSDEANVDVKPYLTTAENVDNWEDEKSVYESSDFEVEANENTVVMKGSRQINLRVKNQESEKTIPYTIRVKVEDELGVPVPDISINTVLRQDIGGNPAYPIKTTNDSGIVEYRATGSDRLELDIEILDSKIYTFNTSINAIFYKNSATGRIEEIDSYGFRHVSTNTVDEKGNPIINLIILAEQVESKYNMYLYKVDKGANSTILNSPATFTVTKVQENVVGNVPENVVDENSDNIVDENPDNSVEGNPDNTENEGNDEENNDYTDDSSNIIGDTELIVEANKQTDSNGMVSFTNIEMPEEVGTYTYKIYEMEAPLGYKKIEEPIEIKITFGYNTSGEKIIVKVESSDESVCKKANISDKGIAFNVYNREEVDEDQFMLNIFKVDKETLDKLNGAVFKVKLSDDKGTYVYVESGENTDRDGQLDYCYIEQDKNYEVRLKQMKRPTVEEIRNTGNSVLVQNYVLQEVSAPDGYDTDNTEVNLTIEFEIGTDADGNEIVQIRDDGVYTDHPELLEITDIGEDQISANFFNNVAGAATFEINYDSNTVENVQYMPSSPQLKITGVQVTIDANTPERQGYKFEEWNTEPDGSGTSFKPGDPYSIDAPLTLYAQWTVAEYVIHYEANAPISDETGVEIGRVTNMPADQDKSHFNDITISDIIPKIPTQGRNYMFDSWNTEADGSGDVYNPGDVYNLNESKTLYAQWKYAITYVPNVPIDEDGFVMETIRDWNSLLTQEDRDNTEDDYHRQYELVNDIDDKFILDQNLQMNGYIFKEWNTAADGTGNAYNPGDRYTDKKALKLYAIWEYKITYDENKPTDADGFYIDATIANIPETKIVRASRVRGDDNISVADNGDLPILTSENPLVGTYNFKEWNTNPDGTGISYSMEGQDYITGDNGELVYNTGTNGIPRKTYDKNIGLTLYAIWELDDEIYLKSNDYLITDENYLTYTGNKYEYEDGDKYMLGLTARITSGNRVFAEGTSKELLLDSIETNAESKKIYKVDGNELPSGQYVGTGMTLELILGSKKLEIKLIVAGDCKDSTSTQRGYGDGYLDVGDIAEMTNVQLDPSLVTEELLLSLDIGANNSRLDAKDLAVIKQIKVSGYIENSNEKKGVEYYGEIN